MQTNKHLRSLKLLESCTKQAQRLYRMQKYESAISEADKVLRLSPHNVPMLLLKARAIQLLDDNESINKYSIKFVKDVLLMARTADPRSIDALNELAFYVFAVEDNDTKAIGLFDKSVALAIENLREAYTGRIKCLTDMDKLTEDQARRETEKLSRTLKKLEISEREKGEKPQY
jgi:tetratricopeptide (TPR) repeat protein